MADNPTISVDITVMLEKLQTELRRAEEMVAASAGRINASLGMGGGVGGAGVPGVTAATAAASAGAAAPMPPSSFVPSAAGARVGMVGMSGGFGGAAAGAGGAAGLLGGSRLGRSILTRFAGPAAIVGLAMQTARQYDAAIMDSLSGERGIIESLIGAVPDDVVERGLLYGGGLPGFLRHGRASADRYRRRRTGMEDAIERSPIATALRDEIGALDFGRRMSEMERVGDTRGMEQMIIRRTVTETLQQADTLRAAGISPEMIDRRNEAIARSLAEELGGTTGGVDEFATAAGMFRTGAASAERTNEILNEIRTLMGIVTDTLERQLMADIADTGGLPGIFGGGQ